MTAARARQKAAEPAETPMPENITVDVFVLVAADPGSVLSDPKTFADVLKAMHEEIAAHVPDLASAKGRQAISSLAYKVTKTKTAIEAERKKLTADMRAEIKAIDDKGREIRETLDALADKVREPLTRWEEAEAKRRADAEEAISDMRRAGFVMVDDTADGAQARLDAVSARVFEGAEWDGFRQQAIEARDTAVQSLAAGIARLRQQEAEAAERERERAELERLKAEAAAREAEDRRRAEEEAARLKAERDAAEKAAREKREAEERARLEKEAAEKARIAAEQKAKREADEAEARHRAEIGRVAREAAEKVEAEKRRLAAEAEAAERKRLAEAQAKRDAEEKAARDAERRAATKTHQARVMRAAEKALIDAGLSDAAATTAIAAIYAGKIPAVAIQF